MDQKRFEEAKRKIIGVDRQRLGIGTLSEKTVQPYAGKVTGVFTFVSGDNCLSHSL